MKPNYKGLAALLCLLSLGFTAFSQSLKTVKRLDIEPEIHFCPVSYDYHPVHVPRGVQTRNGNNDTEFVVTYDGRITSQARSAFENGVLGILKDLFDTPVPINIHLDWRPLDNGALAGASPTAFFTRLPNAPNPNEAYPVALAEKIARFPLNDPDEADIFITVNSEAEWYFDFENPDSIGRQFDFVTVLLHEVFHGLGFTAVVRVTFDGLGLIGLFGDGRHSIYSEFLVDGEGTQIASLQDTSMALGSELTSNDLFFSLISNQEEEIKVFAPSDFNRGSSISHLDEATFNGTEDALMTPNIRPGEVINHPGLALDMMYDMGWDMTYLLHASLPGKEDVTEDQLLEVEVISDSEFDESSLFLNYSRDSFTNQHLTQPLVFNPATGLYEATLPAPGEEATYSYFFSALNSRGVVFTNPGEAPLNTFKFQYQVDREAPVVQHDPPEEIVNVDSSLVVEAEITDVFLGVSSATINWSINEREQPPVEMEQQEGFSPGDLTDTYIGTLVFPDGPLAEGDSVTYRIVAVDESSASNTTVAPDTGLWTVPVVPVQGAVVSYINDFNDPTDDFTDTELEIRQVEGFSDMALHSPHPYPEAGQGNFRNLVSELTIPIAIREEEPLIQFDEIVLVEIGEPGAVFGDDEFWDYVIVEGKRVGASEWLPFLPGYDSDDNSTWRNAFNRGDSGSPSLFFPRTIDMTANGNFQAGDEVFIRFRLFTDPFLSGWGWAIDNLRIQDQTTAVEEFIVEENFTISPNPVRGNEVLISLDLKKPSDDIAINLYDMYGRQIASYPVQGSHESIRQSIPVMQLPAGIYIVQVTFNDRDGISKRMIRH
ncbi:MAG: T9SS type A sorting domain-containing protein [Saprospiraceae bacterium]|nr:T9SS type A sorting domain-containing protein [Saprospiraceae bacterium]